MDQMLLTQIAPIIVSAALIGIAIYVWRSHTKLVNTGEKAEGVIFEYNAESNSTGQKAFIYPTIRFVTKTNEWITKQYKIGFTFKPQKTGTKVEVYYDPADPDNFTYLPSPINLVLVFLIGAAILFLSFAVYSILFPGS